MCQWRAISLFRRQLSSKRYLINKLLFFCLVTVLQKRTDSRYYNVHIFSNQIQRVFGKLLSGPDRTCGQVWYIWWILSSMHRLLQTRCALQFFKASKFPMIDPHHTL